MASSLLQERYPDTCYPNKSGTDVLSPLTNGTIVVERDFKVNGIYCRPLGPGRGVLQLLLHGGTYNKKMWSGFGIGDDYDWQATATSHGYHTLAIDRLGHGDDRQYLDPIRHVQGGLESEIIHQVIGIIRKGGFRNPLWQRFRRIAYVGHSFGTAVGIALVSKYPTDIDALVAIGFSTSFNGTSLRDLGDLTPAASVSRRFAHLPKGYLTCRSSSNREALLYAGFYDDRIPKFDYRLQDTLTVGEHCYIGFVTPAIGFTKPVLAVVGDNDKIFCDDVTESCVNKLKVTGQRLLPNSDYHIYVPRNTGHTLMLHYTAHQTMHVVHKFLQKHLT
ncbi:Alpha/Beta hydrolase protein [Bombardia bombarda]|uniref:Alpha/Beta hydrolase protein n=1 Tax=Bombardia bombarda TaxID=252184 RepID=A0AA39WU55_9PEZI|nr:Alpha/Beta hydrolase protein [Bombardia bombarda]